MKYSIIENEYERQRGSIEVVCGSMFSGKTEELLRRLRRAQIANQKVCIIKPSIDTRYDETLVVSHDRNSIPSSPISHSSEICNIVGEADVIGIDEAQFLDNDLPLVVQQLADQGKRIIIAGLDMDFKRKPFGPMAELCAIADSVDKIHAICMECGRLANYSFRLVAGEEQVLLGETDRYHPLCRHCYLRHQKQSL